MKFLKRIRVMAILVLIFALFSFFYFKDFIYAATDYSSLNFDGSTSWVGGIAINEIQNHTNESITAWIYPEGSWDAVIGTYRSSEINRTNRQFSIVFGTDSSSPYDDFRQINISAVLPNGTIPFICDTDNKFDPNEWYFLAYTSPDYDTNPSGTDQFKFYVNGIEQPMTCGTDNDPGANSFIFKDALNLSEGDQLQIGAKSDGNPGNSHINYFDGKIDEVRIYNKVLSQAEVQTLYENFLDESVSNLVHRYTFDEGQGSIAYDDQGTRDAAINGNTNYTAGYTNFRVVPKALDADSNLINSISTSVEEMEFKIYPSEELNSGDGIVINLDDFDISGVTPATDVSITQENGGTDLIVGAITKDGQEIKIVITTQSDNPYGEITVIVDNVETPGSTSTQTLSTITYDLGGDGFGGTTDTIEFQTIAGYLIANPEDYDVEITANVDPTLSLSLSSTTCNLNTFSTTNIRTCSYDVTVTTNATGGYSAYIREDDDLKNSASDMITDTASSYITSGGSGTDEEYGIGVDTQDTADIFPDYSGVDSCANLDNQSSTDLPAEPITGNDQRFVTYTDPADGGSNHGQTTICHGAAIIGTTPAGVYSHNVIITVTGNF